LRISKRKKRLEKKEEDKKLHQYIMYYQNFQSFFKSVIGYDGENWESDIDSVNSPWISHDMEKMLDPKNKIGYPSLLHLFTITSLLGYCINPFPSGREGNDKDFECFWNTYLINVDDIYNKKIIKYLLEGIRGKLAHVYFTRNAITTFSNREYHFRVMEAKNEKYLFISVRDFWEDIKKAIGSLYNDLSINKEKSIIFIERLEKLDEKRLKYNDKHLESSQSTKKTTFKPDDSPNGYSSYSEGMSGVSGP
jgi:predicted transcriptional regulator YdeE